MAPIGVLMPTYTQWGPILQNDTTYCQSRNYENRVEIVASYLVKESGYIIEQLRKIVEIGKARGSFDVCDRRGEQVLYCKPLDVAQMKKQLCEKLTDLESELTELRKLPDYVTHFERQEVADRIQALRDDADYDRIATELKKVFEQNDQRLPGYFDRLEERLRTARNGAKSVLSWVA